MGERNDVINAIFLIGKLRQESVSDWICGGMEALSLSFPVSVDPGLSLTSSRSKYIMPLELFNGCEIFHGF